MSAVLPTGWVVTSLRELVSLKTGPFGSSLHGSDYVADGIPIINPMHMEGGRISASNKHRVSVETADRLHDFKVQLNDIVIGRRGEMGRCAVVRQRERGWLCGTGSLIVRSTIGLDADFLQRYLSSDAVVKYLLQASVGSTMANLNQEVLMAITVSLPPRTEQTRIVDKLEELLSDLDAGVAELRAAQKKLAQYRQSLLKAAVEGRLTEAWRAQRGPEADSEESGAQLLARILRERRARWEAKQLAKFEAQGKAPAKGWQDKYPEPIAPNPRGLSELPKGWSWVSLDMLGEIASGVAKGTKRDEKIVVREVPYLRVANVQRGYLDLSEMKTIPANERDIAELTLEDGDVLFNEGGDRDKLGRGWVWRSEVPSCIHQNHVFRMRPLSPELQPELISHHGNTFGKLWFQTAGKQTTNLASINMGMLREFPVPLAPAAEQAEILDQLQLQLVAVAEQGTSIEYALRQFAAQRKNILQSAFSGQLVPQDPNDEPASALLARIRAERGAQSQAGGASRRQRRVASE